MKIRLPKEMKIEKNSVSIMRQKIMLIKEMNVCLPENYFYFLYS